MTKKRRYGEGKFCSPKSIPEDHKRAVDALRAAQLPDAAYAAAVVDEIKKTWAARWRLKESRTVPGCYHRLLGDTSCQWACRDLPLVDHHSLWNRDGQPFVFVYHPYTELDTDSMRTLLRMSDEMGLEFRLSAESWYFPSRTLMIMVIRRGELREAMMA